MVLQLNSLWVLVLATFIIAVTCSFAHAATPYSFYEFESKDFISSSSSRPIKFPDGYGLDIPLRNIVGTCKLDDTLYIGTSSAIYKMVNPSKFVKIFDAGVNKDFTCGDKYLFYISSSKTAIVRIDLTTAESFSFTPTWAGNTYSHIKGLAYSKGYLYFGHFDKISQVSFIASISYQFYIEKIGFDGSNLTKLYITDTFDLSNYNSVTGTIYIYYKKLEALYIQPTDKDLKQSIDKFIIYGIDNIGISFSIDADETIYFLIDGDYSMDAPQKRIYKITQPSPTNAELIAYCSYGDTSDLDGNAANSKCGPLSTYFNFNSKSYFLSNNNIKLFSDSKVSTVLSFEKNLVSATFIDSKTLIVAESAALYLVDFNELSSVKIAGGDVENIGDGNSYKFASFGSINKIAKKDNFLYIAETERIRKVDLISNIITTVVTTAPYYPRTLTIDDNDVIYSMATNGGKTYLLKITQTGNINIVFGGASTGGSTATSSSGCGSSCFWGEMTFGAYSKKSQSVYAMQLSSYREYLCKHSAIDQSKTCNQISDMTSTSYKPVVLNVAVSGDYVYVFKKFVCYIYSLDLEWVGEIYPVSTYGSVGSIVYVSDREQIFVTDPDYVTFYTIVKNIAIAATDSKTKALVGKASDLLLLDDGSIMYVHPPTNSIKILVPKSCINYIPGLTEIDFANKCEVKCNGKYSTAADVCSGHGQCAYSYDMSKQVATTACKCKAGFSGPNCETIACPSCAVKCFDILANETSVCSGHGSCISLDKCSCEANYYGDNCQYTTCNGIASDNSTVCSRNGVCSGYNNCACNSGSSGIDCEKSTCFGVSNSDSNVCSGRGSCVSLDTCQCQKGYIGKQCQTMSCFGIPATSPYVCSAHGTCSNPDTCSCTDSFTGTICNITTCGGRRTDDLYACGSMDSGYCERKDVCVCKPGMTKTDATTCKKPCSGTTCSGVISTYRLCQSHFCAPIHCENRTTYGDAFCTANGMSYCGDSNYCTFECASNNDCISKEYRQKCDTSSSSSSTYRTCTKSCSSNNDCTTERLPVCVDYGTKGSRCERKPCTTSSNCTNPAYPTCFRSFCDDLECRSNSDCSTIEGKEFCNKNGTCTAKPCIVSSECADAGVSTHCSYSPLYRYNVCSKVECTTDENCKNTNGLSVCVKNACTMKTCKSDSECPQDGVNKYCIDSKCSAYYPPCATSKDCSSFIDTPTCDTNLTQCVPTKCKYGKDCPDSGCRVTPYSTIYGATTKVCTLECTTNAHCSNVPGRPDCNTQSFTCEERKCTANNDCPQDGANKYCKGGKCVTSCLVDNDCYGSFNVCMAKNGYECANYNLDDVCEANDDCPNKFGVCMTSLKTGIKNCGKECISNSNCTNPAKPFCDFTNYECKEKSCEGDFDCLSFSFSPKCSNGKCNAECNNDLECGLRPGTSKCETSKFKCITQTCTNDDSCKSYSGGYFPHCVNGMCRHECTHDYDCTVPGKGKCERPANAKDSDGGICVAQSCSSDSQCASLNNRNSVCKNSVCDFECNSNSDCNDKILGKHVCKDNRCINYCSATQPCTSPWFSICKQDNTCGMTCGTGADCVSIQTPKCFHNNTNYGSMCVPSSVCTIDDDCSTANDYNYAYSSCLNRTCANCLQNSDCVYYGKDKYYCGLDENGLTVCTYQRCSSTSDCPSSKTCWKASTFGFSFTNPETKICLDYNCKYDADCKGTLNKHSCRGGKCSPTCSSDADCGTGTPFPTCNTTSNDCTFKKCTSSSDCTFGSYTNCREGSCVPECLSNSDCAGRNDGNTHCSQYGRCDDYCDSDADCTNPWYSKCLSNRCNRECEFSNCKSVDKPLCLKNETNSGSKCMPFTCTTDATCSNPNISPFYYKCIDGTCANCKKDADCANSAFLGLNFCGIGWGGYQACVYKSCSVSGNDCPTEFFCGSSATVGPVSSEQLGNTDRDICISGCLVDDHCKNTVSKHKCNTVIKKCEANCQTDSQCSGAMPTCNKAIGDCTYKPCTDKSQCPSAAFSCTNNTCIPECLTSSDCTTAAKPKCTNFACVPECTSDNECGNGFCVDNKCRTYKPCTDKSQCPSAAFSCTNNSCIPECFTSSDCTTAAKPKCTNYACVPECTSDYECGNGKPFCVNNKCRSNQPCEGDGSCDGTKGCVLHLDDTKSCDYKLCNDDSDCKNLFFKSCKPASTFSFSISGLTTNTSATVCSPECTANTHCKDPKYPTCNTKNGVCGPECVIDSDCSSAPNNRKFCNAGSCASCDQIVNKDVCAATNQVCIKDTSGNSGCAFKKCTTSSDCATFGKYSSCTPWNTISSANSQYRLYYGASDSVCYYECYGYPNIPCTNPEKPRCDYTAAKCVGECSTAVDCSGGKICLNNKCSTGCTDNSQCRQASEICQPLLTKEMGCGNKLCNSNSDCTDPRFSYCVVASSRYISTSHLSTNTTQKACAAECTLASDCKDPNKPKCSNSQCVGECFSDIDCQKISSTTPLCKQNKCVKKLCETSKDCLGMGLNTFCRSGVCQAQCSSDADCPTSSPHCTTIAYLGSFKYCTNKDKYCTTTGFSTFKEDIGASVCVCTLGKSGKFCQITTNSSTCTFGDVVLQGDEGTVLRTADSITNIGICNCKGGYSGSICTIPERQCTKQCVYGQCVGSGASPKCICDAGYVGDLCDSICNLKCGNGTCVNTTGIAKCNCNAGFDGELCENQSTNSPCTLQCVTGKCSNVNGVQKCICPPDFAGEFCEKKLPNPCNLKCVNGQCTNTTGIATCYCMPGFEGELCEKQLNVPCTLQCVTGQCANINGVQKCVCPPGFEGDLCEKKLPNPCNLKCVNGECANATGIAKCICASGFEGELCDKKSVNPCLLACVNGQCSNTTGIAKCICNSGFEGELCEKQSTTPCTLQCVTGQCANINGVQKCICPPGFEGEFCEKKLPNPCNLKCVNGQCTNTTGIAKCNCNAGFEGELCEKQSPTPCNLKCVNGQCTNTTGIATCYCMPGFEGELCEKQLNVPCTLQCVTGQCANINGVQKCVCPPGFEGDLCEKKLPNPCNLRCVSGQCTNTTGIAKCNCMPGFEGELCDKKIPNPCALKCVNGLCQNTTGIAKCMCNNGFEGYLCEQQSCNLKCAFGQCANVNGVSNCICNAGYEGDLCEKKIPNPCNLKCINGQCANSTGIAKCVCSTGFEGDLCEKRVCSRQCLNGGSCKFDASNNQICSCINGYSGALCQTSPDQQEVACKLACLNGGVCTNTTGVAKCLCTSELFVGDLCASCKSGFILQKGVCVCPFGSNNENGNCVRLPADCAGGCGQYGQCIYKDTTGYQGYCKCQENYVTELSTNPCGSCISGYVKNAQGKCIRVCPPEFTGEDCNIYTPAASCVPIPPSALSFCKAHLQSFKVLNTHYASGAGNATDARQMITTAIAQLDKAAKSMYDSNLAKISSQGAVCNSTCEESNARLACYSQIQSCNSPSAPETRLCKSVCNYIIKDIRTYYPDFEDSCSNLQDTSCFYGAYLPPDTSCYGKLYTDSSVCNGKGDCVGTDKCICKSGFTGSQCSSAVCFGKPADQADVCSSNGVCSGPNRCTCNNGFNGLECNVVTCNGKSEKEGGCSYRGVCSSVTRSCVCNGNFDGASCSKCKEGFSGPQCDIPICNGISSIDKAVCGGRGACKSEDGIPKCQCFDGYEGSNCQTFVCNGTDRLSPDVCSSKGKCVGVDTCSCAKNYNPASYCSTCLPSFDGVNCETKKCTPELTCGGRGTCDSQFKCVCSDKFTGPFCERCVDGFVGDKCQYQCSAETTCNRKGTCSNDGSCICSGNAEGANCETCKSGWFGEKCDFSVDTSSFGFSENGDSITATVMSSLKKRIECSSLITNSQVLGNNPICSLNGEKSLLTITLGTSSSIIIGGTLNVKKHFDTNLATDVTIAQADYKAVEPVAVLVADKSTISKACGSIYLDASGSSSLDRRSLIYTWATTVAPSSTEVLDSIISKQSTPGVKFTAADLDVGTYVVQVTVKSSFSLKESVASVTFSVIAATPPTISIKNGLESSMVIGSPYIISPIVTFPSCYKGSGNLVYTYTLESGSPIVLQQKNELLVFSNEYTKLTVEGDYVFKLTAKEEGSPEASVTFKVTATALPLKVSFNIRDMTQSFEDLLSFAISKQDPSNPTEAGGQVSLSCVNIDTASTCDDFVNGAQNIDQSTLKFEKSMKPGVYSFTATYTKSTRSSTASVKVTVSDQSKSTVLRVSIAAPKDADLVAIDPSNDFVLQASSLDTLTSARLLTWSSSDFTFDASIDISKQYIIIPKSLLAPGASYTVTVKVVDGQKSGEASLSFTVNSPPTMGTFEISPKAGTALTDEFKISCGNGWSDPQLPLSFAFYSKLSSETTWRLLKEKSETRSFGTSLPAGELDIKVMVYDSKGASTETTTSVSVSMPKDASSAISALTSSSSGTMTTSSLSSALSVIQSVKTEDPELKKQFAEVGKQMVLSYFEQKATEENLSSQTSTSTSSTLSVISSISSCVDNLPDETIRMIIEKFKSATNGASSSSSISLSDEEIKSSTDSASTIQSYVSTSLGGKRSLFASSFTMDDLNKIDQVKNNLLNIKLKNVVPDMPAVRGTGVKSASYVRLVNIASLNGLLESVADNGITKFNLSSVFSEIPQLSSLDSVKISMKVYDNTNTTFKSTSKIFDFIVSQTDNSNVKIQYNKSIAQLTIEKTNSTARAIQEPKCSMVVDGAITDALSSCAIIGTHSDSYVISITSTGSYVIGTTSTTSDVQPETSTVAENPTPVTPILPKPTTPNLDYIALILLVIPVLLIVVGVVGLIVYVVRRNKGKHHAAPQNYELRSTV